MNAAVIVAGGSGSRMKSSVKKQYLDLGGRPVVAHTLMAFDACTIIDRIILVVPEDDVDYCRTDIVAPLTLAHDVHVLAGGPQRQASVSNGLAAMDASDGIVMIHDGVRPFVRLSLLNACLEGVRTTGACIPAIPASDTLKRVDENGVILKTLDRRQIMLAQTPQTFSIGLIRSAHQLAIERGFIATDDASIAEFAGKTVTVVPGDRMNIKITTPEDLPVARTILRRWVTSANNPFMHAFSPAPSMAENDSGKQAGQLFRVVADNVTRAFQKVFDHQRASGIRQSNLHKIRFLFAIKAEQTVIGPSVVDDGTADFPSGKALHGSNEIACLEMVCLTEFGHDVDHVINGRRYGFKLFFKTGNDKIGDDAGKQVTWSQDDIVRIRDGFQHRREDGDGVTVVGNQVDIPYGFTLVAPGGVDGAFTKNPAAVSQFCYQGGPVDGDRQDFTPGIQNLGQGLYPGRKTAGVARQHGQEHVPGIVSLQAPVFVEPFLKDGAGSFLVGGQGQNALEDITGGQGPQFITEATGAASAVHHGDNGADTDVRYVSQPGQQGVLAAPAADGDHMKRFFSPFGLHIRHGFPLMPRMAGLFLAVVFQSMVFESVVAGDAFGDNQPLPFFRAVRQHLGVVPGSFFSI
jgi:2-C-methyl-D-erythritol 4-phosphate cytidylyltransferase